MCLDNLLPPKVVIHNASSFDLTLVWKGNRSQSVSYWNITVYDAKTGEILKVMLITVVGNAFLKISIMTKLDLQSVFKTFCLERFKETR